MEERGKQLATNIMMNLAGQGSGRNVPAYNKHEQAGRTGLVNPGAVG